MTWRPQKCCLLFFLLCLTTIDSNADVSSTNESPSGARSRMNLRRHLSRHFKAQSDSVTGEHGEKKLRDSSRRRLASFNEMSSLAGLETNHLEKSERRNEPLSENEVQLAVGLFDQPQDGIADSRDAALERTHEGSLVVFQPSALPRGMPLCRIQGICRVGDGSYLLPTWMKIHKEILASCGLEQGVSFALRRVQKSGKNASNSFPGETTWQVTSLDRSIPTLSENLSGYDIVGGIAPRELMHWLVTDLAPPLFIIDYMGRQRSTEMNESASNAKCFGRDGEHSCEEKAAEPFNPAILVDVRISDLQPHLWPVGLLRLFRNSFPRPLRVLDERDVYQWRIRSHASCFQSLITTKATIKNLSPAMFPDEHIMWQANELSRRSAQIDASVRQRERENAPCVVKVLILNKYGKRYMVSHDALRQAVKKQATLARRKNPGLTILPETVFFEKSSFHEQVSVMQETNVVVSSHGSSNANIMFLRPDTTVIEIMPFGLAPTTNRDIAKAFGVHYHRVTAQPDSEVFTSCVRHYNPRPSGRIARTLTQWREHADVFERKTVRQKTNPETTFRIPEVEKTDADGHARECAAFQRLTFHVDHVASMVVEAGMRQCGVKSLRSRHYRQK